MRKRERQRERKTERKTERERKTDRERERDRGGQDNRWMRSVGEMIVDRSSTRM